MKTHLPIVERLLKTWQVALGEHFEAYRNHIYRVINLTHHFHDSMTEEEANLLQVAGAFHDIGIWLDGNFDYLERSADHACAWLAQHPDMGTRSLESEQRLVRNLIRYHHKVRSVDPVMDPLVEAFRKADWTDITGLYFMAGLSKAERRELFFRFPEKGFKRTLAGLAFAHARRNPRTPLPMVRW